MQSFMLYNTSKKNNQKSSADDLHLYLKWHPFTVFFFKHFASTNQLSG